MKQIVQNYRTGILKVDDVPLPSLRDGGLLIANRVSLISPGTEKSTVTVAQKGLIGKALDRPEMVRKVLQSIQKDGMIETVKRVFERLDTPAALGYSCAGAVLAAGRDTAYFSIGDRIACAGQNYASHAEIVYVPKHLCANIPPEVDFEEASFVTLGAIALQGVRQAEVQLGDRIAVIGLGLVGLLTLQILKASGCQVLGSDLDTAKLELAKELGADFVCLPSTVVEAAASFTEGHGMDAVIITATTKESGPVEVAGTISRRKGRVIIVGAVGMTLPREPYYKKELDLRLSTSYGPGRYDSNYEENGQDYPYGYVRWTENRNMRAFLELLQQKKVNVKRLISHRYSIEQATDAYKLMMENDVPYLGILVTYPPDQRVERSRVIELIVTQPAGPITIGLIGAGNHVRDILLPLLKTLEQVTIRGVCTGSGINAKAIGQKIGAAYCTTDPQVIFEDVSINAVLVGTRHDSHASYVIRALEAGKHVFIEKPLCLTHQELDQIASVYQDKARKGLHLMVGFNRRFSSHGQKAHAFFDDRKNPLVMIYRVNAGRIHSDHWIQSHDVGGGRIVGEACHFVDYMQSICGAPPISIHGRHIAQDSSGITEDQCILTLAFRDGSIGTVIYTAAGETTLSKERFEVHGDGKSLTMDDFLTSEFYSRGRKVTFRSSKRDKGFSQELTQFVEAIQQGRTSAMKFEETYAVTRACLLAVESLRSGAVYEI